MKTNDLRKYVKSRLDTISTSYYQDAPDSAMFPHIVFEFTSIDLGDIYRQDYILTVDIWNKNNQASAETMADSICELLQNQNVPQANILPTFWRESRKSVKDDDKDINHIQLEFLTQVYDK